MSKKYPLNSDYEKALKKGGGIFNSLHNIEIIPSKTRPFKLFSHGTGSYAVVFKGKISNNIIALRCFQTSTIDIQTRYNKIKEYFDKKRPPWYVECVFLDNEILIDNLRYPVLSMEWAKGKPLNDYVNDIINDNSSLTNLQIKLIELSTSLEKYKVGHGDIQCGNVFIENKSNDINISLVDYDNIYIPELEKMGSKELGQSQFQHPSRSKTDYNFKIDRFSIWVCLTALEALKYDKTLWRDKNKAGVSGYNTGENMLFEGGDFKNPNSSKLFMKLLNNEESAVVEYAQELKEYSMSTIDSIQKPKLIGKTTKVKTDKTKIIPKPAKKTPIINKKTEQLILSKPVGAIVLNNKLIKIGVTPIVVDRSVPENKILHLQMLGKNRDIKLYDSTKNQIVVDFEDEKTISQSTKKKITPKINTDNSKTDKTKTSKNKITEDVETIDFSIEPPGSSVVINDVGFISTVKRKYKHDFKNDEELNIKISKEGYLTKSFKVSPNEKFPYKKISLEEKKSYTAIVSTIAAICIVILIIITADQARTINDKTVLFNDLNKDLHKSFPIVIKDILLSNKEGTDIITSYGKKLWSHKMRYLHPKIIFKNSTKERKKLTFKIKIITPDGSLKKGESSPVGYSYINERTISKYSQETEISGWGNESASTYSNGEYKIEVWYYDTEYKQDRILYSTNFTIY